jgi:hypothetical protein
MVPPGPDTAGRKRIRSGTSALNQVNNEHNNGNHEQKMDQTAANVATANISWGASGKNPSEVSVAA